MPIGLKTNFVIDNPFIYTGYTEMLTQFSNAFNAQSNGALTLTAESIMGDTAQSSYFQNIAGLVRDRDPTSNADVDDKVIPMGTITTVKVNRGIGPVAHTYDSFRKIGVQGNIPDGHNTTGINLMDYIVGQQTAKGVQVEKINMALLALTTALRQIAGVKYANTAGTLDNAALVNGLAKMGDAAGNNVRIWVMHSKAYYNLILTQIASGIDSVTGFTLANAQPITLNRPVLVIDSPSLVIPNGVSAGVNSYITLGLGAGAAEVIDSEDMMLASQLITGKQNLAIRLQGEYSYNLGVRGFTYDVASGGINPSATAIGTAANWDKAYADVKDLGGVVIETA
jgi:hypothetical protein